MQPLGLYARKENVRRGCVRCVIGMAGRIVISLERELELSRLHNEFSMVAKRWLQERLGGVQDPRAVQPAELWTQFIFRGLRGVQDQLHDLRKQQDQVLSSLLDECRRDSVCEKKSYYGSD